MDRITWDTSTDPDAMFRFAAERGIPWQQLTTIATACARHGLKHIPTEEQRPAQALEVVKQWANGLPLMRGLQWEVETAKAAAKDLSLNIAAGRAATACALVVEAAFHADTTAAEIAEEQQVMERSQQRAEAITSYGSWNPAIPNRAMIEQYGIADVRNHINWLRTTFTGKVGDLCARSTGKVAAAAAWAADRVATNLYTWDERQANEAAARAEANRAMADIIRSMIAPVDLGY